MTLPEKTFQILDGGAAIQCLLCGQTSHNPTDVEQRYCGRCHRHHERLQPSGPLSFLPNPTVVAKTDQAAIAAFFGRPPTGDELREVMRWHQAQACELARLAGEADAEAALATAAFLDGART